MMSTSTSLVSSCETARNFPGFFAANFWAADGVASEVSKG